MHKLLERQLRAAARKDGKDVDLHALIAIVDQTYDEFDRERRLNDRAAKLMEDELIEANKQAQREHDVVLATILESASDGMLVTDGGVVDTANAAAELQFGAARGKLTGQPIEKLMGSAATAIAAERSANGRSHEATAETQDGRSFPVEFSVNPMGARQLWIVRDISERIRTQREIVESRLRFQDFAEASSDCFFELDSTLTRVEAHSATDPTLASYVSTLLTPGPGGKAAAGVPDESWNTLRQTMELRQGFRALRLSMAHKGGRTLHLSLSGKPVFDLDGKFRGFRGTGRDITREVTAQDAARRAERRMVEAMEGAPSAIALVDAGGNFVAGNSVLRLLSPGHNEQLWPGRSFGTFLSGLLGSDSGELWRDLVATGEPREIQTGESWMLLAGRKLSDGGVVLTFSDVTALKEREREFAEAKRAAESANQLKSQFLATMSHELRTPLNAILGFSEIVRDEVFGRDERAWNKYANYAGAIHASGGHLLSLISEILDMSKIEAGSYVLDLQKVDVGEIVSDAANIVSAAARKGGVEMHVAMPETPVAINGDARSLRQITLNLLSNAIKFTPAGGHVRVGLATDGCNVTLTVADSGIGIAKQDLEAVFEPFRQVDSSVRRRHEGTGLGLAITRRLVDLHRGSITLESQPSVGTTVRVILPVDLKDLTGVAA